MAALLGLLAGPLVAQGQGRAATPPKEADVKRLLEATGQGAAAMQVLEAVLGSIKPMYPAVPESVWAEMLAEMRKEELTALIVPIYTKHLSDEDVRGMLAFYESPVGRKLVQVQPLIIKDSMVAGRQWGEAAAGRVIRRLQEKGYSGKSRSE